MTHSPHPLATMSLFTYPGGKTRAARFILPHFSEDVQVLYSPFFGGGSIEIACFKERGISIVANDKFEHLILFWKVLKLRPDRLQAAINTYRQSPVTSTEYKLFKRELMTTSLDHDPVDKAAKFFIVNRCSYGGTTLAGGFTAGSARKSLTESSVRRLGQTNLKKFEFHNMDFEQFIKRVVPDEEGHFMYLDPPYHLSRSNSVLYGPDGSLHKQFDHERLREVLRSRNRWVMSYNDCPYIRSLYEGHRIISLDWYCSMNSDKKCSEILIFSNDCNIM